jgi:hypothetical protein
MSTLGIISRGKLGSARLAAAPGINVARIGGPMAGWCSYVKAFSNLFAHQIPQLARPSGAEDRTQCRFPPMTSEPSVSLLHSLIIGFDTLMRDR